MLQILKLQNTTRQIVKSPPSPSDRAAPSPPTHRAARPRPPLSPLSSASSSPATRAAILLLRRRDMSDSSSASRPSWPQHGPVPMERCPDCERIAPLVRLTCTSDKNGNKGREFVKCESKPEGQVRSHDFALISFSLCSEFFFLGSEI